jgi:hypothetical protein
MNYKYLVRILELKQNLYTTDDQTINDYDTKSSDDDNTQIILNIYPKTISIMANLDEFGGSNSYFINSNDNKLYKYDMNGNNPYLVNGNFLIALTNPEAYLNKAYIVINGDLKEINSYFDGSKLIINNKEINKEGLIILTDDCKLYVKIGNSWFGK